MITGSWQVEWDQLCLYINQLLIDKTKDIQINNCFSVLQRSEWLTHQNGKIPPFGFLDVWGFSIVNLLQPLSRWCCEMRCAPVGLSAKTATNCPGGRANVKKISTSVFDIYWCSFFENVQAKICFPRECGICMENLVDGNCNCERRKMDDDGRSVWDNVCTCRWTAHGSRRRHFDHDHSELRQQFAVAK